MLKKGIISVLILILFLVLVSCGLVASQSFKEENVEETIIADKEKQIEKNVRKEETKLKNQAEDNKLEDNTKETETEDDTRVMGTENEDGNKATIEQSTGNKPSATEKGEKKTEAKSPSTSTPILKKDSITTKSTTATESIPFQTVYQSDANLEKGKQVVAQNGSNGTKTITYKETYTNGTLTSKNVVSSSVTKQPVNKIVKVGTKVVQAAPTKLSASQAHSILGGSGMSKSGNYYSLRDDFGEIVGVEVGGNGIIMIRYNGRAYLSFSGTKE
ncbi:G5 domain-containing protein [Bacillus sp. JJ1533]|uniref:G5 domain-containing protein n=1 Tax=Bacillus sp. JJ1533 TaxID=3122959 RepID=UPI002FFE36C1